MLTLPSKLRMDAGDARASVAKRALEAVRMHLGMEVAYVSEIVGDDSVFREVDAPGLGEMISVGDVHNLETVYCRHILEGRLPELIPDTAALPLAVSMPITQAVPIGSHVSVPIRRPSGEVYGMFCCLSPRPNPSLNERDLHIVRAFAELVAEDIAQDSLAKASLATKAASVEAAMAPGAIAIALQPICELASGRVAAFEALARFRCAPAQTPDRWFADAAEVGMGVALECAAIAQALSLLPTLEPHQRLSVNASPATVMSDALAAVIAAAPADRLVLELTEHEAVDDYDLLCDRLDALRATGVRLAIDDAGAGVSSLQHILRLKPDSIKLDISLTRNVDTDPARRALAVALLLFARQTGAVLVAEGVETAAELEALRALGVTMGQGYHLGRPQIVELSDAGRERLSA